MRKRAIPALVLPSLLLLAAMAMMPPGASAATAAKHPHHHAHFFLKKNLHRHLASQDASGNNLNYGGGPVMGGTANVYAIFWEPTGNVQAGYNSLIQRYFNDVNGTGLYKNNTQYHDSSGRYPSAEHLVTSWVDTSAYPESPLLDSDIQNE